MIQLRRAAEVERLPSSRIGNVWHVVGGKERGPSVHALGPLFFLSGYLSDILAHIV